MACFCVYWGYKVLDDIVPNLEKRIERDQRKRRATEKQRQHECNIILDPEGGYGRTIRNRKAKYTFEEYERAMAEAIDEGILSSSAESEYEESECASLDISMEIEENITFDVSMEGDSRASDGDDL